METLNSQLKQYTWAVVLLGIIISFVIPQFGFWLKPHLTPLIMLLMFLSCLNLDFHQIISSFSDIKYQTISLVIIHLVSPLIVFILRDFFTNEIFLGLIIASTIASGRSSAFLSSIYGGNTLKALVVSSVSASLSPIVVPFLVWLFAKTTITVNPFEMSYTIIYTVILPLIAAIIIGKTNFGKKLDHFSTSISVIVLFLIILGIISPIIHLIIANPSQTIFLSILVSVLIIIDFSLGYLLGTTRSDHLAYAISNSYKNYTLAVILSLSLFNPNVAIPAVVYTVVSNFLLIPLQLFLSRKQSFE